MFKKIQKYLLVNQPLLWNTKVVPVCSFLILIHLIFFIIGYQCGQIDWSETKRHFSNKNTDIMFFFSIVISIITVILWLVFYFKNNAFKSYYPKNNWSLFKEWLIILGITVLLCSFQVSYLQGYDSRVRSYYSEEEARQRCETISKASLFYGENYDSPVRIDSVINDTATVVALDYVKFDNKKYALESLINKSVTGFPFHDSTHDSLMKRKIKLWLINGKTDSLKVVMKEYFKLIEEHGLYSNINQAKWFSLVYNPPTFIQKRLVAKRQSELFGSPDDYAYEEYAYAVPAVESEQKLDTLNEYVKEIKGVKYTYYKTFVPADELEYNYEKIAEAYINPSVDSELFLGVFYFAICLSILIFSFRVTSGRNWLITLIALGVINILLGIMTAIASYPTLYLWGLLALILVALTYYILILVKNTRKGISAILLNSLMWMLPAFVPIIYAIIWDILRKVHLYENNYYTEEYKEHPSLVWMDEHFAAMGWYNLLFIILMMMLLSYNIKRWKGMAEG